MSDFTCFSWGIEVAGALSWEIMYSYCKINSVADLVITFTVTGDFALTPVAERFYSTFHAAKCRTFQNFPPLGPLFGSSSSLSFLIFFYCCLFVFSGPSILLPLYFFLLGLLLYLLTIIMYISQSGSGTARRGVGATHSLLRHPASPCISVYVMLVT